MPERGRTTPQPAEMQPRGELRVAPPIPVRDLLGGRQIQEPQGLNLADAPIHIASVQRGSTTVYTALIDAPIADNTFLPFLKQAAPEKGFDSRRGVVADWELPELTGEENERRE